MRWTTRSMPGVEPGHVDGRCSFESILQKYGMDDPAILLRRAIVRGADTPEDLTTSPSQP